MSRPATALALVLAASGAAGCFDVHTVAPGALLIDDFDDGNFQPADPDFHTWACDSIMPINQQVVCGQDVGDGSPYSLVMNATIVDPIDGEQNHGGAEAQTQTPIPVDLTRYDQIVFSSQLASGNPPLPSAAQLYVEIGCSTVPAEDGSGKGTLYVVSGAQYKPYWLTQTRTMSNFGPPPWISTAIQGGTPGCLQHADSIRFSIDAALPDGATGTFTFHLDDVEFL